MKFVNLPEFESDFKRLKKRYRTIDDDFEVFKRVLEQMPEEDGIGRFVISGTGIQRKIIKVKKFACRALKHKGAQSGIRIIYSYHKEENKIEFVEIYYKGDKELEDRKRILKHYKERL
ncbi:MAG: hypothetical protein KA120_03625 [Candidatus Goldbacteria bacterium]|nr:hypothetical protein [Candidatus Goldiibacteriota bacterium]